MNDLEESIEFVTQRLKLWLLPPIKRKIYKVIYDRLLMLQKSLLEINEKDISENILIRLSKFKNLLISKYKNESAGWDLADIIKEILVEVASKEILYQMLIEETSRDEDYPFNWNAYFPNSDIGSLLSTYENNPENFNSQKVREKLLTLYKIRDDKGRHDRTRENMRGLYLVIMSIFLILCIIILLTTSHIQCDISAWSILVAGGIGAILSRSLKMKELKRIVELKGVWLTLFPQMVIGATLGLIIVIVLQSGIIELKIGENSLSDTNPYTLIIISFISGFSEPYALGIINKIAND